MKVLFDIRGAQVALRRGIGRYISSILHEMVQNDSLDVSVLITNNPEPHVDYPDFIDRYSGKIKVYAYEDFDRNEIRDRFDYFITGAFFSAQEFVFNKVVDYNFPRNIIKYCDQIVGIMHDFIILDFAGSILYCDGNGIRFSYQYALMFDALEIVNHFFTVSEFVSGKGVEYLKRPAKDFTTIYGGVDIEKFGLKKFDARKYKIGDRENNIVAVGLSSENKNYRGLATAFAIAYNSGKIPRDSKLYLINKYEGLFEQNVRNICSEYNLTFGGQIVATDYIPDLESAKILYSARALVHASFIEGLGLPMLESYALGTPVFGSNQTAIKEFILPECSFDPGDPNDMADRIIELYNDEDLCGRSLEFGRKLLKKVNWKNASDSLVSKLKELKNDFKKTDRAAVFIYGENNFIKKHVQYFSQKPNNFDIFVDVKNLDDFDGLQKLKHGKYSNIFPMLSYEDCGLFSSHVKKVFIIGDKKSLENIENQNNYLFVKGLKGLESLIKKPENKNLILLDL